VRTFTQIFDATNIYNFLTIYVPVGYGHSQSFVLLDIKAG